MVLMIWEPVLASVAVIIATLLLVNAALSIVSRLATIGRRLFRKVQ